MATIVFTTFAEVQNALQTFINRTTPRSLLVKFSTTTCRRGALCRTNNTTISLLERRSLFASNFGQCSR